MWTDMWNRLLRWLHVDGFALLQIVAEQVLGKPRRTTKLQEKRPLFLTDLAEYLTISGNCLTQGLKRGL